MADDLFRAGISYEIEYKFHPTRKWRFDFALPLHKIAVEVEGASWSGGRHTRGAGFAADCEKYSIAATLGWRVIRATTEQVMGRMAIAWVVDAINYDDSSDKYNHVAMVAESDSIKPV